MKEALPLILPLLLLLCLCGTVGRCNTMPECSYQESPCPLQSTIAHFDPSDTLRIFWLEAPLMEYDFGNFLGRFGLKHAAIGVESTLQQKNYTIEYVAKYGFFNTSIPHVITFDDGSQDLLWCNEGYLCTYEGIEQAYWNHSVYPSANIFFLAQMPGSQFNEALDALYAWDVPAYNLWLVQDKKTGTVWFSTDTCQDFALWFVNQLFDDGAKFQCSVKVDTSDFDIFSGKPSLADYSDPVTHNEIIDFYQLWQLNYNMTLRDVLEQLKQMAKYPMKYVYNNGQYYLLDPEFPYLDLILKNHTLPGCNYVAASPPCFF